MIENKDLGLKIAVNKDEAFWTETKEKCLDGIASAERNIKIDKMLISLCDRELKRFRDA